MKDKSHICAVKSSDTETRVVNGIFHESNGGDDFRRVGVNKQNKLI